MADIDATSLPTSIPTPLDVTALAKRFGVSRTTIQRRLKKGWVPPATVPPAAGAAPDAASALVPDAPPGRSVAAAVPAPALALAMAMAICSAAFSIGGLTSIFASAFWPVIWAGRRVRRRQAV